MFNQHYDVLIRLMKNFEEVLTSMNGLWRLKNWKPSISYNWIRHTNATCEVEPSGTWKSPCVKRFYGTHVAKNEGSKLVAYLAKWLRLWCALWQQTW